ncbi:Polysaccharide lyase family 8 protein [Mycena sanguinolenta]|uniref:Polysaccharide lyase family 8 protein n=1 Tax=Mycena sanguinolenta TaxID=230812 RepID=A0A8H6XFF1_9AGAR|nr:Polysaccharide lyase family 8 protein [Mycena sanguinolenta]
MRTFSLSLPLLLNISTIHAAVVSSSTANITTTTTPTSISLASTSALSSAAQVSNSANATSITSLSATPTVSTQPSATSTPINSTTAQDIETLTQRRLSNIVGALTNASSIGTWLSILNASGQFPDVDYTTGCPAQRANWPAENHWVRLSTMAGAWHGGLAGAEQYVKDPSLRSSISLAMGYCYYASPACLDSGGTATCPCGTPGLWNTNWFPNIIGTPELVSMTCLLLNDTLSATELGNCTKITGRAYNTFIVPANQVGVLTGANALDVAKIGIDLALLTTNVSLLTDAYSRVHSQMVLTTPDRADGIRPDGSFGQHTGIIYNGNYGKDFTNDIVDLEVEAGGTQFQVSPAGQTAFATLFDGDSWMIYYNALTKVLHWDFSVLGRFIAFPTADFTQATGSILLNLTKIGVLGDEWGSDELVNFSTSLSGNFTNANAGKLVGNRMFYDNDYMVQRGASYVSTLRMFSTRSTNTECTNLANPFGFHLSDGSLRTYIQGNEYEDIAAAMDWNLIPGITTDYGATPLNCAQTGAIGIESFVGGVSNGQIGVGAMRYTNPLTKSLHWQKSWFFLDNDVQVVLVSNISSTTNASVISVLDQRLHNGPVMIDKKDIATPFASHGASSQSLWHGNVGYTFPSTNFSLSVQVGKKTGNWSVIGTSTQPPNTVDLFAAWLIHESPTASLAYTIYPGTNFKTFITKSSESKVQVVQNDGLISAVLDSKNSKAMAVFWAPSGGSVTFAPGSPSAMTISTNGTAAVMFDTKARVVTVSDPTHLLTALSVTLTQGKWEGQRYEALLSLYLAQVKVSQAVVSLEKSSVTVYATPSGYINHNSLLTGLVF